MEKIIEQGILYDFYGPLLTKHQQDIYEAAVYDNLSLSEIAEVYGISRQGVHDIIKRCDKILLDYESKLNLVSRFSECKNKLLLVRENITCSNKNTSINENDINKLIDEIIDSL